MLKNKEGSDLVSCEIGEHPGNSGGQTRIANEKESLEGNDKHAPVLPNRPRESPKLNYDFKET